MYTRESVMDVTFDYALYLCMHICMHSAHSCTQCPTHKCVCTHMFTHTGFVMSACFFNTDRSAAYWRSPEKSSYYIFIMHSQIVIRMKDFTRSTQTMILACHSRSDLRENRHLPRNGATVSDAWHAVRWLVEPAVERVARVRPLHPWPSSQRPTLSLHLLCLQAQEEGGG